MRSAATRWTLGATACLIALLVLVTYAGSLSNGPVWDDRYLVTENPHLQSFDGLRVLLENDLWTASGKREPSSFYRPLTMVTFWLNAQVVDVSAASMRAGNVLIHAVNALLLWLLLRRLLEPPREMLAAVLAGLWGVLAINGEPVLWISGRFDPLTAMAALACMLANRRQGAAGTSLVVAAATCGLLFKEAFMGWLPLLLLDDLLLQRRALRSLLPKYVALGVVVGLNILLRKAVGIPSLSVVAETGLWTLVESYLYTFATLVPRAFVPYGLDPFHPYAALSLPANVALGILLFAVTGWLGWRALRSGSEPHARLSAFGWCWLVLGLVPASLTGPNLFMIGDRYAYLPFVGLLILCHAEVSALTTRLRNLTHRADVIVGAAVALASLGQAWALARRIPDWKDDKTLAEASARSHTNNPYALYTLGTMAIDGGDLDRAERLLLVAADGNPRCWRTANALCVLRMRQGRYGEALPQCQRSLAIHGSNPRAWVNLASVHVNEKRWQLALETSLKAVEVKPFFPEARYLAAVSYANLGDLDRAREHLAVGLAEDPTHAGLIDLQAQMARRGK